MEYSNLINNSHCRRRRGEGGGAGRVRSRIVRDSSEPSKKTWSPRVEKGLFFIDDQYDIEAPSLDNIGIVRGMNFDGVSLGLT